MPILASNFTSNSLQGTVVVSGGQANIQLPLSAFAFEGQKTFQVKLRREGFTGIVLALSNVITIPDTTSIVSLTANISTVAEGNAILYTLTTANVPNGTNVYYSTNAIITANVNSNDFVGGNTGIITINNNVGTLTLVANADLSNVSELAETFALQIRTNNASGNIVVTSSNVLILDISNTYAINSLVESSNSIITPSNVTFTVSVSNIPAGTTLYYDTVGTATTNTFNGGNTGSFKINTANTGTNTVVLGNVTLGIGQSGSFALNIRRDSNTGTILATSNTIVISGLSAYYTMTGGNITYSNQYKIHAFTTSANLVVTAVSGDVTNGNVDVLIVAGGGGSAQPGGGGGAGGVLYGTTTSLSATPYTVTVGAGGFGSGNGYTGAGPGSSTQGSPSGLGPAMVATGGGRYTGTAGGPGGSGSGGGNSTASIPRSAGVSTQSPAGGLTGYGNPGGVGYAPNNAPYAAGGGGGAGASGGSAAPGTGGNGGVGIAVPWAPNSYGTPGPAPGLQYFAGGAGGGTDDTSGHIGGAGGGTRGAYGITATPSNQTTPGTINTGGGGGGGNRQWFGADGGSGIVLIRYPYTAYYANVVETSNLAGKGTNVTFNLSASGANAITLYYSTSGNVNSSHFIGGNTGSFVANGTGGLITLQTNYDTILDGNKRFALQVRTNNTAGNVVVTSGNVYLTNSVVVSYLVVGAGGQGFATDSPGPLNGGGGGGGGVLTGNTYLISGQTYTITVGAGIVDAANPSQNGAPGWFAYSDYGGGTTSMTGSGISLTAIAGGRGGACWGVPMLADGKNGLSAGNYSARTDGATPGGSGGGAGQTNPFDRSAAPVYSQPYIPAGETANPASLAGGTGTQGYPGGSTTLGGNNGSAGGGGAGGTGQPAALGGNGGAAYQWMDGNWYAGGGAGKSGGFGGGQPPSTPALKGGGGDYTTGAPIPSPGAGGVNTGGGGGSATKPFPWPSTQMHSGGSGIVVLRYPNTLPLATSTTGTNTVVYANANIYYRFTGSGTITF